MSDSRAFRGTGTPVPADPSLLSRDGSAPEFVLPLGRVRSLIWPPAVRCPPFKFGYLGMHALDFICTSFGLAIEFDQLRAQEPDRLHGDDHERHDESIPWSIEPMLCHVPSLSPNIESGMALGNHHAGPASAIGGFVTTADRCRSSCRLRRRPRSTSSPEPWPRR